MSWRNFWLTGLVRCALGALVLAACSTTSREPVINLSAAPATGKAATLGANGSEQLVFAVAAVNSPRSTFAAYEEMARYLGNAVGLKPRLLGSKTYSEINALVQSGEAALAMVCSAAYVYGNWEFGMEALAIPQVKGQTKYYSYLIVPESSPARSWRDLKGRTFAFTDPLSNSGRLVALYQLWEMGTTPEAFFSRSIFTYSHDNSIKSVAWQVVDAAVVDSLVYDYALARGEADAIKTRKIWQSPPYEINPIVTHPRLDAGLKARLQRELLQMHESEAGRALLLRLGFDRFVPSRNEEYDSIRDMARLTGVRDRR